MNGNGTGRRFSRPGIDRMAAVTEAETQDKVELLTRHVVDLAKQVHDLRRAIPTPKRIEHLARIAHREAFRPQIDEICEALNAIVQILKGFRDDGTISQERYDELMWR